MVLKERNRYRLSKIDYERIAVPTGRVKNVAEERKKSHFHFNEPV